MSNDPAKDRRAGVERTVRSGVVLGELMLGRYRVVRELARGGMGVVYLARSEGAGGFVRPVVLKLVLPDHASDERFLGMFVREAKILSDLRHPSIVPVLDFGEDAGAHVMVLEYVRGYHLGQWQRYVRMQGRTLPADVILLLMTDVLDALHKAHGMCHPDGTSMHIVHRDVSPSNILLDEDGRARLLDFGVARMRGGSLDYQTQVQSFVGKLTYSAPELFDGTDATPRSDLYSVGVVLHEALLGHNVFKAETDAQVLYNVLHYEPDPLEMARPDVPRGLDAVLERALAKTPERRFASAREFADALRTLVAAQESSLRARAADLLRQDFGEAMATALGVDSLATRDHAWRDFDEDRSPGEHTVMLDVDELGPGDEGPSSVRARERAQRVKTGETQGVAAPLTPGAPPRSAVSTGSLPRLKVPPPPQRTGAFPVAAPNVTGAFPVAAPNVTGAHPAPSSLAARLGAQPALLAASLGVAALVIAALVVVFVPRRASVATPAVIRVASPSAVPEQVEAEHRARAAEAAAALATARENKVREHAEQFRACFKRKPVARPRPSSVRLAFEVDPEGIPLEVSLIPPSLEGSTLGRCLRQVGEGLLFPVSDAPSTFSIDVSSD